jgi:hypothetical protein
VSACHANVTAWNAYPNVCNYLECFSVSRLWTAEPSRHVDCACPLPFVCLTTRSGPCCLSCALARYSLFCSLSLSLSPPLYSLVLSLCLCLPYFFLSTLRTFSVCLVFLFCLSLLLFKDSSFETSSELNIKWMSFLINFTFVFSTFQREYSLCIIPNSTCRIFILGRFYPVVSVTMTCLGVPSITTIFISLFSFSHMFRPLQSLSKTITPRMDPVLGYTNKLHGLSPRANYTDRATAACRRSDCQLLRIEGATWSAWRITTAVFSVF